LEEEPGKKALSAMARHAPVEAITTGGQKATSKLQRRRSREKELDKLAARQVIRAKRNRFLKPHINGQERDEIAAKN
jgi:hypothetical protein